MKIGVNNLVNFGLLWTGISTMAFGPIEFIPHNITEIFAVSGFVIRTAQGIGTSATVQAAFTILADTFVDHRTLVMVSNYFVYIYQLLQSSHINSRV